MTPPYTSVYVHVPFCRHRCGYCDFTLIAGRDDLVGRYLKALKRELSQTDVAGPLETLFLGGGTPTHPEPADLARLLSMLRDRYPLAPDAEFSVEANPLDLTDEKIAILADHGVNRVSLGVQSFHGEVLKLLERDHQADDIADTVERLRRRIANISLDLIFGVPGQTLPMWERDLADAAALEPSHLSTYGLTFEPGTMFTRRQQRGELAAIPEELERTMYAHAMAWLPARGFEQYEISNFARPGMGSRHNQVYWSGAPYAAFGPGAARYLAGTRSTNIRSVHGWLQKLERGESPVAESETLEPDHAAREFLFIALRRTRGVSRAEFRQQTGFDLDAFAGPTIKGLVAQGWLDDDGRRIAVSPEGRFVADRVVAEFL